MLSGSILPCLRMKYDMILSLHTLASRCEGHTCHHKEYIDQHGPHVREILGGTFDLVFDPDYIHEWQIMNVFAKCDDDIDSMIEHLRHLLSLGDKAFLEQAFHPHEKDRDLRKRKEILRALIYLLPIYNSAFFRTEWRYVISPSLKEAVKATGIELSGYRVKEDIEWLTGLSLGCSRLFAVVSYFAAPSGYGFEEMEGTAFLVGMLSQQEMVNTILVVASHELTHFPLHNPYWWENPEIRKSVVRLIEDERFKAVWDKRFRHDYSPEGLFEENLVSALEFILSEKWDVKRTEPNDKFKERYMILAPSLYRAIREQRDRRGFRTIYDLLAWAIREGMVSIDDDIVEHAL